MGKIDKREFALFLFLAFALVVGVNFFSLAVAEPSGVSNVTVLSNERASSGGAGQHSADAGNVSELTLYGESVTQTWQGYYGNITGLITLEDSSGDVLYNWSLASPGGEVYASTNSSVTWANIQCLNFTANGTYSDESGLGGSTSQAGVNVTSLETEYNIGASSVDGVDETFTLIGAGTHDEFYTANQQFSVGECRSTRVYGDTGQGESDEFEEVLLYEPATTSVVFAALLESDVLGFDQRAHDFEMLVLEDGHSGDTTATTYFFFAELE